MDPIAAHASLTDTGEYALHRAIATILNSRLGEQVIGDDAAIMRVDPSRFDSIVVSTDRLASGVPPSLRAKLLIAQTVSDVICMGAKPIGIVVAAQWPRQSRTSEVLTFVEATEAEAERYGCRIVGGDTKEGSQFAAVGTVLAVGRESDLLRRTPIYIGDYVAVTSAGGRRWGSRWANQLAASYDLAPGSQLREALEGTDLEINLPILESNALTSRRLVRAGLDLSDGIGASLRILSEANSIGFDIFPEALDGIVDPQAARVSQMLGVSPRALAMSPGYMWENMYAIDPHSVTDATAAAEAVGGRLTIIGVARAKENGVTYGGKASEVVDAASDEKFKHYAWEDRVSHWVDSMKGLDL